MRPGNSNSPLWLALLVLLTPAAVRAADMAGIDPDSATPLTAGEKFRLYLDSTAGPSSLFSSAFSSGYNQAVDSVPEWGQGMEGYGKRFASSLGQKAVGNTVRFGLQTMLREDPRYYYSRRAGLWSRGWYAVGQTFVAHKDEGGARPNYSGFAGVAAGTYLSRQWRPEHDRTAGEYAQTGAISIGVQAAKNVFKEFWPDIRKRFLKR